MEGAAIYRQTGSCIKCIPEMLNLKQQNLDQMETISRLKCEAQKLEFKRALSDITNAHT